MNQQRWSSWSPLSGKGHVGVFSGHSCLMLLCVITTEIQIRTMALQYSGSCITPPTGAVVGAGKKGDMAFLMKMEYSTY